jgi:hypothetical protein
MGGSEVIRDNGDAVEAIVLMVVGFGLTFLLVLAMDKIENIYKSKKGKA